MEDRVLMKMTNEEKYIHYHNRIEGLQDLYDARSLLFEMMEEKGNILKPVLPKLREEYTKKARELRNQEHGTDNHLEEKREKDIVSDDITDINLIQAGYYWNSGYNEFDFTFTFAIYISVIVLINSLYFLYIRLKACFLTF